MVDKLGIYNGALLTHLDTRPLLTLNDARTERRALDAVYPDTLAWMLEQGMWNFAARADQWPASQTAVPNWGFDFYVEKPSDYVRLIKFSENEHLEPTLNRWSEEGDFFAVDVDPVYVLYVSNDITLGGDPGKWGPSFAAAFQAELAWRGQGGVRPLSAVAKDELRKLKKKLLENAQAKDAVNQAPSQLPVGRLVRSRAGFRGNDRMRRTPYA